MPLDVPAPLASPALGAAPRLLRLGYLPLADAAPLLAADALGLFAAQGLRITLSREAAWATLRDKLAFGVLDAAQLLGPMAIALTVGAGGVRQRLTVTAGLARNGNTLVLSPELHAPDAPLPLDPRRFAERLRARPRPPTLAVVFPHSSHNYLLRHWLARGGLDPDRDGRLVVVPPPEMARALAEGRIDGFCAGEPWGSHAIATGAGHLALATGDIWPDHPEKVLAFATAEEDTALAATAAVLEAQLWLDDPAHRDDAVALLRDRAFPHLSAETVAAGLRGEVAAAPGQAPHALAAPLRFSASAPRPEEAGWWFDAMRRWNHLPAETPRAVALAPWRPDLWHAAAARLDPAAGATLAARHAATATHLPQDTSA